MRDPSAVEAVLSGSGEDGSKKNKEESKTKTQTFKMEHCDCMKTINASTYETGKTNRSREINQVGNEPWRIALARRSVAGNEISI